MLTVSVVFSLAIGGLLQLFGFGKWMIPVPPPMHLILLTRADPPLPLARLLRE